MEARQSRLGPRTLIWAGIPLLALLAAMVLATPSKAGYYRMVLCAGNTGTPAYGYSTNTVSAQHPGGIFDVVNNCGLAPYPAGDAAWIRINEHEPNGNAGVDAYGDVYYDTPAFVHYKAAGSYTRQPNAFNEGWRARLWILDFANNGIQLMTQGMGLCNCSGQWASGNTFGPHIWPFGSYLDFWRFVYELKCVRSAGCDRANFNATDANTFTFVLSDDQNSQVGFAGSPLVNGQWSRGTHNVVWSSSDNGSGLRFERLYADGGPRFTIDYKAIGSCNTETGFGEEFARAFQPCPVGGPFPRNFFFDTTTLLDGTHSLQVCTQDYGQAVGIAGTGGQTCDNRTINVDNTPPGPPAGLEVTSANSARYLDHFGTHWSLPPNTGSPIVAIHYNIINAADNVVVPEQRVPGTNLSAIPNVSGPDKAGNYRIRVWLEDAVGFQGPASTAPIPHDTVPPAAPQNVSVTAPDKSRAADGFDVRWRNIVDAGSPIDTVHYEVLNAAGAPVVPAQVVGGQNIEAIPNLESPENVGKYTLRMWLSDAEGNQGAAASVPLAYECVRSAIKGGEALSSGMGQQAVPNEVVEEGSGSTVRGSLKGVGGAGVGNAPICVFSRIVTDQQRDFLGLAMTGPDGGYKFPVQPGASRELIVIHRRDHRELTSHATIQTIVHPTLKVRKKVIYNKHVARFFGEIPGPHNDRVVIVLQAKVGKGWSAFRRYRTRDDGKYSLSYRFRRTFQRRKYVMRAQVRQTVGYPYLQGNSKRLQLLVLPPKTTR